MILNNEESILDLIEDTHTVGVYIVMVDIAKGPPGSVKKCVVHVHELCYALFIGLNNIELLERLKSDLIPLMHSFKVNIRVCLAEISNVNRGKASVNITFER